MDLPRKCRFAVLVPAVVVLLAGRAAAEPTITILHTNDMHGDLAALCRVAAVVEEIRKDTPDTLLLDAGDFSHENRSAEHVRRQRPLMLDLMGRIGYLAATPGNHEMDGAVVRRHIRSSRVALLYANPTAEALQKDGARTVPFIVREVAGVRIGIVGLTVQGAPVAARARQIMPQVRSRADVVVALSHLGLPSDEALAREVPGIDLIVGGHQHIDLQPPRMVAGTAIVCAGGHGEFIGCTTITLGEDKRVKAVGGRLISLWTPEVVPHPRLWRAVSQEVAHVSGSRVRLGDQIGEAAEAFTGRRSDMETPMGNLAADMLRARFKSEVALLRGNVMSPQLAKGPITVADAYHTIRWDAPAVTLTLSGSLLRQVLEHGLDDDPHYRLRTSGVRIWYDMTRPKGARIVRAEVNGQPLKDDRDYPIAVEDWLASGRTGYVGFLKANHVKRTTLDIRDLLIEHIRKAKTITPPPIDRAVDATKSKAAA